MINGSLFILRIVNGTVHKYEGAKTFDGLFEFVNTYVSL